MGNVEGMNKTGFTHRSSSYSPLLDVATVGEAEVPAIVKATAGHFLL